MADVDDKEVWYSEGCATFGIQSYRKTKTSEYGGGTIGGYQSPLALADSLSMRLPDLAEPTIFSSRLSVPSMKHPVWP